MKQFLLSFTSLALIGVVGINDADAAEQEEVADLVNEEREERGLDPLELDEDLSEVAQVKSEDMNENNYFSHVSPVYGSPLMMSEFGIEYMRAAENIAMGQQTSEQVMDGWMNSDGHRQNILDPELTHIGVGYEEDGNYWTQMFISE